MIGCSVCEQLGLLLRNTTERVNHVEVRLSEAMMRDISGNTPESTGLLLHEAIEARNIVDAARAVFVDHLQFHLTRLRLDLESTGEDQRP